MGGARAPVLDGAHGANTPWFGSRLVCRLTTSLVTGSIYSTVHSLTLAELCWFPVLSMASDLLSFEGEGVDRSD